MPLTIFALRLCRWPMKCQRNASPYAACFACEVLRAVLADDLDSRLGQRPPCPRADTYFVAATTVTPGPTSALIRSYAARTASGDMADHALACRAALPSRRCEKKSSGWQRVQRSSRSTRSHAGLAERPLGATSRGRACGRARRPAPKRRAVRLGDLGADLVAARADRRPDDRGGATAAERGHGRPRRRPRAARASRRAGRRARAGRRSCARPRSGGSRRPSRASAGPARRSRGRRRARRARPPCAGARSRRACWRLSASRAAIGADARRTGSGRFSSHVLALVAAQPAEVQRRERPLAHAAVPRREGDLVGPGRVPAEELHGALRAAGAASAVSHSRVFSDGLPTTSRRSARSVRPSAGPGA